MRKVTIFLFSVVILLASFGVTLGQTRQEESLGESAERAGQLREALKDYVAALQSVADGSADDQRLREKIIKVVQKLDPPPALPEEAEKYMIRGGLAVKSAKTKEDFNSAIAEFKKALRIAPWLADGYYNLGLVQAEAGDHQGAISSLKFYLMAAPSARDAQAVRRKIIELEYLQETFPNRSITIVAPYPPGGVADLTARSVGAVMERILKNSVVVLNKTGAAGAEGMSYVANSKPDGYTLLLTPSSISTIPEIVALFGRKPAFTLDQFFGIARLNADPPLLVVGATTPWKTVKELVEDGKKRPGEITYSSSGVYGTAHVPMEMFLHAAGLRMRHLPTGGVSSALTAVLGGHAAMGALPPAIAPYLQARKILALATWGRSRLAAFPDVPTMKELGYDIEYYVWAGLFSPRNVPANAIKVLRDATRQAIQDPEFKGAMEKIKTSIAYQDTDEFRAWWERDAQSLAKVIKRIGRIDSK